MFSCWCHPLCYRNKYFSKSKEAEGTQSFCQTKIDHPKYGETWKNIQTGKCYQIVRIVSEIQNKDFCFVVYSDRDARLYLNPLPEFVGLAPLFTKVELTVPPSVIIEVNEPEPHEDDEWENV